MAELPTTFSETLLPLLPETLDKAGREALLELDQKGFEVVRGLRRADVPDIIAIANQIGVQEFCPRDIRERFGDEAMTEDWLAKRRVFFQLRSKLGETSLVGYGWTGPEAYREMPDCQTGFAIRLSEAVAGQGLGRLFTLAIVSASMALGMRKIGLETWQSNIGAWKTYQYAGAVLDNAVSRPDTRATIAERTTQRIRRRQRDDVRLFMRFAQTFAKE